MLSKNEKAGYKTVPTEQFHLYKILEQARLIMVERSKAADLRKWG